MTKEASPAKMTGVLAGVAIIAAGVLGYIHTVTYEKIEQNRQARVLEAVYSVLPGSDRHEEVSGDPLIFRGFSGGEVYGWAVLAEGMGFQGNITLMAGIDAELKKLTGVMILETVETPGLGDRIRSEDYLGQYRGLSTGPGMISVDTITGATLSSEAVEKIVARAVRYAENVR